MSISPICPLGPTAGYSSYLQAVAPSQGVSRMGECPATGSQKSVTVPGAATEGTGDAVTAQTQATPKPQVVPVPGLPCTFVDVPPAGRCFFGAVLASGKVRDQYSDSFLTFNDASYFKRTSFSRLQDMLPTVRFLWEATTLREEGTVRERYGNSVEEWLRKSFLEVGNGEETVIMWAGRLEALVTVLLTRLRVVTLACYKLPRGGAQWCATDLVQELLSTGVASSFPILYQLKTRPVVMLLHHKCGSAVESTKVREANHFVYLVPPLEGTVPLGDCAVLERLRPLLEARVGVDRATELDAG
eukprot:GHVU01141667.1.p1 GENE.GHVU01141667.1~~GHVU01141667.1.p1  ORF type:complete len:301 (-),score=28.84 GHVU01141667.1:175-1077(-)